MSESNEIRVVPGTDPENPIGVSSPLKEAVTQEGFDALSAKYQEIWADFSGLRSAVSVLGKQVDGLNITGSNVMLKLPKMLADIGRGQGIMPAIDALQACYKKLEEKYNG